MRTNIVLLVVVALSGCGVSFDGGDVARSAPRTSRQPVLSCPASPAKKVFTSAMCLCGDYAAVGQGAWVQGGAAGLNGSLDVVGRHDFSGDVVAYGGVSGVGDLTVGGSLSTAGSVDTVGDIEVAGDLNAASGVSGVGRLTVKGTLRTPEAEAWTGRASIGAKGAVEPLSGPPCGCGKDQVLDIAAVMATAIERNDNQAAGLSLHESIGERSLVLGSGSYVFDGVQAVGAHTLTVDGAVALFVKGDFETVGSTHLKLTPGSTLDLYIDGEVNMVGDSSFGEGASPGAVKLYVAGTRKLGLVGSQSVVGSIYAPASDLELVGESTFDGALFVRNVHGVGRLSVTFAGQKVAEPGDELCRAQPVVKGIE
ncbi:MAG: hypothetical protein JNJ54_30495 [Myxococcaceae bacterium]|nr:hypothetical protein [Myxococcaceae bacterium]